MPRNNFVAIPTPGDTGNADLNKFLNVMKENLELLCAQRGGTNNNAILKGDIETAYPADPIAADLASLTALKETVRKLMVEMKT